MKNKTIPWITVSAFALSMLVFGIEITAMYIIMPAVRHDLHLAPGLISLMVLSYLLLFATTITVGGRLGDIYGHKAIVCIGLLLFIIACGITGGAHSLITLLIGRALQGIAGALVWPNATAMAFNAFPPEKRGLGLGIISSIMGLGLSIGPVLAGYFTVNLSWRWVFYFNIPLCTVALIIILLCTRNSQRSDETRLDWAGASVLTLLLAALTLGLTQLPIDAVWHQYADPALLLSMPLAVLFVLSQRRNPKAILPKQLLQQRVFLKGCGLRILSVAPFYLVMFVFGLYFQENLHLNAADAGLAFLPLTLTIGVMSLVAGRFIDRFGAARTLNYAAISYTIGFLIMLVNHQHLSHSLLSILLIFPGLGFALASPSVLQITMSAAPTTMKGVASAFFYMISIITGLLSTALGSTIMQFFHHGHRVDIRAMAWIMIVCLGASVSYLRYNSMRSNK